MLGALALAKRSIDTHYRRIQKEYNGVPGVERLLNGDHAKYA